MTIRAENRNHFKELRGKLQAIGFTVVECKTSREGDRYRIIPFYSGMVFNEVHMASSRRSAITMMQGFLLDRIQD